MTHATLPLPGKSIDEADDRVADSLKAAQDAMGFVPNMYQTMANSPALFKAYESAYQEFRKHSGFKPDEQEVVFLTVSRYNGCSYCMAAHSMLAAKQSGVPADVIEAIREGNTIEDKRYRALADLTTSLVADRGKADPKLLDAFLQAGFDRQQVLSIIVAIAAKTLSNYSNHLLEPELDEAFSEYRWDGPR